MAIPFSLFLALKYLKPKRSVTSVVTFVSVIGVLLGVAIIIIVRAVMTGFGDMWKEKILDFKPHIMMTSRSATGSNLIQDEQTLCTRLEQIPGVTLALPSLEMQVLVENNRRILAPVLIGADPKRAAHMMKPDAILYGEFNLEGDAAIIGIDLAEQLGLMVGDDILVYSPMNLVEKDQVYFPERLTLTGIYSTGRYDFDSKFVITSLAVARDLMGLKSGVYSIHLKVHDPQNTEKFHAITQDIRTLFPHHTIRTWWEIDRALFDALATEKNMMAILLMFITIVAIFCVMNTLIVLTVQKTNEIGLLKAIGFSSWQVMAAFVLHGWIQCLAGTLLGITAALAVLHNLQNLVNLLARLGLNVFDKRIYGLSQIPWRIEPTEVATVALMVIIFCTIASFLPAWRAARMDPIAALRKE